MSIDVISELDSAENISVDALQEVTSSSSIDLSQFVGIRVPIEKVEAIMIKSKYTTDGKTLAPGQEVLAPVLKVETVPVTTIKDRDGNDIVIRASEMFSLKDTGQVDAAGKKVYGWSTHEKGALNKFLKKLKVSRPAELKGKLVVITTRPGNVEGQEFLGFIKE
jgi:hypothetical protein